MRALTVLLLFFVYYTNAQFTQSKCTVGSNTGVDASCRNNFTEVIQFWLFSTDHNFIPPLNPGKTVIGPGSKILFDFRVPGAQKYPGFWFGDMTRYNSHTPFINDLGLGPDYNACPGLDCFWRCDFQSYVLANGDYVFAYTYNYNAPITEKMMMDACTISAPHTPIRFKHKLGFVSLDPVNQIITPKARAHCEALGFFMATISELLGAGKSDPFVPLHPGIAYGYIKQFPNSTSALKAQDIPVFNQLPLDLSVVSGVITSVFQTVNSHINLKSGERDTPNMVLLNYDKFPCISKNDNKPIKLSVAPYGWSVENSTDAEVTAQYNARLASKKWLALYHDTDRTLYDYDTMCPNNAPQLCLPKKKSIGTKASSLGYLRKVIGTKKDVGSLSAEVGYDLTPIGFGIPFQLFVDFINYPPNANLKVLIRDLNDMELNSEPLPEVRANISKVMKQAFWDAVVPPSVILAIQGAIDKVMTPNKINELKFRSSSNAEDLPGFDGAGLYDSFSALVGSKTPKSKEPCHYNSTLDDMVPPSIECALKGVYGSLWNQRAIEERTFARYRHDSCVMGVAVVPKYKEYGDVTGNAVSLTRLIDGNTEKPGYTFSLQDGDNDVTNPDPGTQSETSLAIILPNKTWIWERSRNAIPVPGGKEFNGFIVPLPLMNIMMKTVVTSEKAYCRDKFGLSAEKCDNMVLNNVKTALDMEFKFIDNTTVHCKQLREFSGTKKKIVEVKPSACGYLDPGYFPPVNGVIYNNVALGASTRSGTPGTFSVPFGNGATVTVTAFANKSVDSFVSMDPTTVTSVSTWWSVAFDLPYTLDFIRLFWCVAPVSYARPATIDFTFTHTTVAGNVTKSTQRFTVGSMAVQQFNLTRVFNVTGINFTTTGTLCYSEAQVFALPYLTGDPDDFLLENRTDTQDCVWDNWSSWGKCSVPCAGGRQSRTRGGKWCVNYIVLDVYEQFQSCNNFVCPVDCKWSDWSAWSQCTTCGWSQRSRTIAVQAVGTGAPCAGTTDDTMECVLNNIPCLRAPPIELQLVVPSTVNVTEFAAMVGDRVAQQLVVDREAVNAYLVPYSGPNGTNYRLLITFNDVASNTSQQLPMTVQKALAEELARKLVGDPSITEIFANQSITYSNMPDSQLGSLGVAAPPSSGPSENPLGIPFYGWLLIGVGGAVILIALVALVACAVRNKPVTVEEMYQKL